MPLNVLLSLDVELEQHVLLGEADEIVLELDEEVREGVELAGRVVVVFVRPLVAIDLARALAEDLQGQQVQLGRLLGALARVPAEQVVAPGDQVVEVLHHRGPHVRGRAQPREDVRPERTEPRLLDLVDHLLLLANELVVGAGVVQQLEQLGDRHVLELSRNSLKFQ
ncbi:hypothetical protein OV079_42205 [Nannocystis pusilla]|uniref:Uncharacterized protein n=1 Tax=Nannocystis pusilla TaxID=889268 RepID=A0A9X3EXK8_9BACT|nr:hypothetical protein [Nannocystis pusilla]MCY1012052.1 hypothetical protein [Nannocystis pusilla]